MVYKEKLVASIKCRGKILREHGDTVYLPFGSEYTVLLKNLNSRKALVDITVDGRRLITSLIVEPDRDVEIERFFEDSLHSGHRLKFIEKTKDIEEHRGNRAEDGLIKISYRFERERFDPIYFLHSFNIGGNPRDIMYTSSNIGSYDSNVTGRLGSSLDVQCSDQSMNYTNNDQGITAEGSYSTQTFRYGDIGPLESEKNVIVIQLKGETENTYISEPLTVKRKLQCKYCGKKEPSSSRFCPNCGAALI